MKKIIAVLLMLALGGMVGCDRTNDRVSEESANGETYESVGEEPTESTEESAPLTESEALETEPANEETETAEAQPAHIDTYNTAESRYFIGTTDKGALDYTIGDVMTMEITLMADDAVAACDYFSYTITTDWGFSEMDKVSGDDGVLTLEVDCEDAGAIRVEVAACDASGAALAGVDLFDGGVLVNFDDIAPALDEPEDFDEFWANELAALFAIEPTALQMEQLTGEDAVEGFEVFDLTINMGEDEPVRAYLSYPTGAEVGTLKGKLTFRGYGAGATPKICEEGYISLSVCAHSIDLNRDEAYYIALNSGELLDYGFNVEENQSPSTCYFRNMLLRDVQAARYVMTMDLWNGVDLEVAGESQGAFQSAGVAALLSDKITKCTLGIPWMCDVGGENLGRLNGWHPEPADGIRYFDTTSFARRIQCSTTIDAKLGDYICPPSGIAALYNELTCPVELTFTQNGTHTYQAPNADAFTKSK